MPGPCLNSFQTDACEWSLGFVWHSSDWVERGIFVVLALMLVYIAFVLIRFSRRHYLVRRESRAFAHDSWRAFHRRQKSLVADLSRGLRTLKGLASSAPFLGLAGTCYWILGGLFFGYSGPTTKFFHLVEARTASSLLTAAIGILVAIPAILVHHVVRTGIDRFENELGSAVPPGMPDEDQDGPPPFRRAQTLPLKKRFPGLPPLALIAAPALASVVAMFMAIEPYETPSGLPVSVALDRCESGLIDRPLVLRITNKGAIFINSEWETRDKLAGRLAEIYRMRQDSTLYLQAEDDVHFQAVADVIDIVMRAKSSNSSLLTIRLITPHTQAVKRHVPRARLD